jgi:hypothetical protein
MGEPASFTPDQLGKLKVRELKDLMREWGLEYTHCLEKSDFVDRLLEHQDAELKKTIKKKKKKESQNNQYQQQQTQQQQQQHSKQQADLEGEHAAAEEEYVAFTTPAAAAAAALDAEDNTANAKDPSEKGRAADEKPDGSYQQCQLLAACAAGDGEGVFSLLEAGVDASMPCALRFACAGGNTMIVTALLINNADPDAIDVDHEGTPLHAAAALGNDLIVHLLLQNSADPTLTAVGGQTALDLARERGHDSVIQIFEAAAFLKDQQDIQEVAAESNRQLVGACKQGDEAQVKALLMSGVDANTVGALRSACIEGKFAIADLLLQAGADPNAEEYGCSSLRHASR